LIKKKKAAYIYIYISENIHSPLLLHTDPCDNPHLGIYIVDWNSYAVFNGYRPLRIPRLGAFPRLQMTYTPTTLRITYAGRPISVSCIKSTSNKQYIYINSTAYLIPVVNTPIVDITRPFPDLEMTSPGSSRR